jgi:hypothetical protein
VSPPEGGRYSVVKSALAAGIVEGVIVHPLKHLQRAFPAGDVRELDIGFERGANRCLVVMDEQTIRTPPRTSL